MPGKRVEKSNEELQQMIEARKAGERTQDIAGKHGVTFGWLRAFLEKNGVFLNKDQRKEAVTKRTITEEQIQQMLQEREQGVFREALLSKYDLNVNTYKAILKERGVTRNEEMTQQHAHAAKLANNPNAMADMRKRITPDVVEKRSEAIRAAYQNPELIKKKSEQTKEWWDSLTPEQRSEVIRIRTENKYKEIYNLMETLADDLDKDNQIA